MRRARQKVSLTGEKATLLITLYAKAEESRLADSLLHDRFAADAVDRIDYDFSSLMVGRDLMIGLAIRADILDGWTREYLANNPGATVLHLGCGLDSRVFRLDPPPAVRWFDVDFPEVIDLRRRLYPTRPGYRMIAASVTDPGWLRAVPADRPAMVIAEGLLAYLRGEEVPLLLGRLVAHLPGGEIAFDAYSRLGIQLLRFNPSIRATGAGLHWGIDDPRELEAQVPGLRLISELASYDPAQIARMSWPARLTIDFVRAVPALRTLGRFLRYRFHPPSRESTPK